MQRAIPAQQGLDERVAVCADVFARQRHVRSTVQGRLQVGDEGLAQDDGDRGVIEAERRREVLLVARADIQVAAQGLEGFGGQALAGHRVGKGQDLALPPGIRGGQERVVGEGFSGGKIMQRGFQQGARAGTHPRLHVDCPPGQFGRGIQADRGA